MNYVLDADALLLHLTGAPIPPRARRAFAAAKAGRARLYLPALELGRIASTFTWGGVASPLTFAGWVAALGDARGLDVEPLRAEDVAQGQLVAGVHDPLQCYLVATAIRLDATLLTPDEELRKCAAVSTAWA